MTEIFKSRIIRQSLTTRQMRTLFDQFQGASNQLLLDGDPEDLFVAERIERGRFGYGLALKTKEEIALASKMVEEVNRWRHN